MNIIELCLSKAKGGLELYLYRASKELNKTDNVFPVVHKDGFLASKFISDGIEIYTLSISFKPLPIFTAVRLAKLIDTNNIDVVHIHWAKDFPLAALAKKISKRKPRLIYTRQMQITRYKKDWYHYFLYKEIDVLITITKNLAENSRKFLDSSIGKRVVPLYYGVSAPDHIISDDERSSLRREWGLGNKPFIVGLFGRIKFEKGQHLVIEAITKLKKANHDVGALIVGHSMDDNYLMQLKNNVKVSALSDDVVFKDFVDDPQRWMQGCDVIILASKEETFGLVLAEAMHAGVAVIGTNSGGVPEIIEHEKTGLMFNFGDVDSLCECILQMKNDEMQRKSYAIAGQDKARRLFDINKHYSELRKLLAG